MYRKALSMVLCLLGLVACSSAPTRAPVAPVPWQDEAFSYDAALVTVNRDDLFRLDPELMRELKDPALAQLSERKRIEHLLERLFGRGKIPFPYAAGHSTVAAQTWQNKRGDCLSLTVLAFSMARAMDMTPDIQEVQVGVLLERRSQVDFFNHHVNVLFRGSGPRNLAQVPLAASDIVVDFEPEIGSFRHGEVLSESAVLARYYNNIAAEHFARDELPLAYAHFKAAIREDPGYTPSYSNLALLYKRAGLQDQAEQLLRYALALSDMADVPLFSLHQLLVEQGRVAEAQEYARLLQSRRERDPYYWIGIGMQRLREGKYRSSIESLERALSLTRGFEEIHRYLALAYWRAGEPLQARQHLGQLAAFSGFEQSVSALHKKFDTAAPR